MKAQQDIFGTNSLKEIDEKLKAKVKPYIPLRPGPRKVRFRSTQLYKEQMRYLYGTNDE